jgi:hypothetical protein
MKKICIFLLVVLFAIPSFAQEESNVSPDKNVIKINTLSLIVLCPTIFYERKLSDMASAQLGVGYLNYTFSSTKFSGVILTPEVRFYLKKNAIDGFYLSPYFRYQNFSLEVDTTGKATYSNYGGGLNIGRQWIFKKGFVIDVFVGGHYSSGSLDIKSGTTDSFNLAKFEGFRTRIGFALGFSF